MGSYAEIDGAAAKLAKATYPFVQGIDWSSDLYSKPLPGASPYAVTKAIDKALVMGAAMDGKLLSDAAQVMDTYNAFAKVVDGSVPAKLYSTVNPGDAVKAYDALITFTNTVKAAQR